MSDKNNTIMIAALLIGAYLYSRRGLPATSYATTPKYTGGVATMPASAGAGLQQAATGALVGFLGQVAKSLTGNGANSYTPSLNNGYQLMTDYNQSGTVQDVVSPFNWDGVSGYADYDATMMA